VPDAHEASPDSTGTSRTSGHPPNTTGLAQNTNDPATPVPSRPVRARVTTSAVFALHAVVFGSWTPHIPLVKDRIGLNDGTLGLALLGGPIGSVIAMVAIGTFIARWGSRRSMIVTMIGYGAVAPLIGLADSLLGLFLALGLLGAFQSGLDISMNAQAVAIEKGYARPVMSSFHAWWSFGAFAGTGIGILGVSIGLGLATQLALVGAVVAVAAPLLARPLIRDDRATDDHRIVLPWGNRWLLLLGAIMFAALLCEGAAGDWAAVYLRDALDAPAAVAGLGYAAFALAMLFGRAMGDRWVAAYGGGRVVAVLAASGAVALAAALFIGHPLAALAGLAVYGLGLACVVPVCFSAAAATSGSHAGHSIAAVATAGWAGFLVGPPAIGTLAHVTSLPLALGLLPILCAAVMVGALRMRGRVPTPELSAAA
jgi:MFS family permease